MGNMCGAETAPRFYFHTLLEELCAYEAKQKGFATAGYVEDVPSLVQDALAGMPLVKGPPQPEGWVEGFEETINLQIKVVAQPTRPILEVIKKEKLSASGVVVLLHHFFTSLPDPLIPITFNDNVRHLVDKSAVMQRQGTQSLIRRLAEAHRERHATVTFVLRELEKSKAVFTEEEMTFLLSSWFREVKGSPFGYAAVFLVDLLPADDQSGPALSQGANATTTSTAAVAPLAARSQGSAGALKPGGAADSEPEEEPPALTEAEKAAKYGNIGGVFVPGATTSKPAVGATGPSASAPLPFLVPSAAKPAVRLPADFEEEAEEEPPKLSEAEKAAKYGNIGGVFVPGASSKPAAAGPSAPLPFLVTPAAASGPPKTSQQKQVEPKDEAEVEPPTLSEAEKAAKYGSVGGVFVPPAAGATAPTTSIALPFLAASSGAAPHTAATSTSKPIPTTTAAPAPSMRPPASDSDTSYDEDDVQAQQQQQQQQRDAHQSAAAARAPPPAPDSAGPLVTSRLADPFKSRSATASESESAARPSSDFVAAAATGSELRDSSPIHGAAAAGGSDRSGYQTDVSVGNGRGGGDGSGWDSGTAAAAKENVNAEGRPTTQNLAVSRAAPLDVSRAAGAQQMPLSAAPEQMDPALVAHAKASLGASGKHLLQAKLIFTQAVNEQEGRGAEGAVPSTAADPSPSQSTPVHNRGNVELCMSIVQHLHKDSVELRKEVGSFVSETAVVLEDLQREVRALRQQNERLEKLVEAATVSKQFRDTMQEAMRETTQNVIELNEEMMALRSKQKECDVAVQSVRQDNDRLGNEVIAARAAASETTMKWCDVERRLLSHEQGLQQQQRQITGVVRDMQSIAANAKQTQLETATLQRRFDVHRDAMLLS